MTDDLVVFGREYENVTGIKATDDNGQVQTYIKPEGTINITTKGLTDVRLFATANVDTGTSVPDGGSTNQVLAKDSDTDGDVTWKTVDKTYVGLGNVDNTSDANKPISTATQTALNGKLSTSLKGANSGLAELDANGKVPTSQLPSFVDDVLEYSDQGSFPSTGETGKIYIAQDTNKTYRWSGTAYVEISSSLALGTTSSTAYRGDYGNTAYTHATDSERSTTAQSSGLYKIATTAQGHVASATAVVKSDITDLGIPAQDTTDLTAMTGTLPIANGGTGKTTASAAANAILGGMSAWTATPTDDTYFIRQDTGGSLSFGRAKFSTLWTYIKSKISSVLGLTETTYSGSAAKVNNHTVASDVPADAVFTDTVYTHPTTSGNKHIPAGGSAGQVLKYSADGTAVWGDVSALPDSTSSNANQVLKLDSSGANPSWGGYSVPTGGYVGQVLSKSNNSSGAFYWKSIDIPSIIGYYNAYTNYYNDTGHCQGLYDTWDYIPGMSSELYNGKDCILTINQTDPTTGETSNYWDYYVTGVSDATTDTSFSSTYFSNEEVYYINCHRTLTDGSVEKKTFEAVYEFDSYSCWMLKDVTTPDSSGLPSGGAKGQILIKNSATDGDVTWTSGGSANQVLSRNSSNNAIWRTIREVPDGNTVAGHPQFLQYDPVSNTYGMAGLVFDVSLYDQYENDENEQPYFSGKFYFNNEPSNIYETWQYGIPIRIHLPLTTSGAKALFNETHDVNEDDLGNYGIPFTVISAIETINTASTAEAGYNITDYTFNISRTLKDGSVESKIISCILDVDQWAYDVFVTNAASIPQASGVSF